MQVQDSPTTNSSTLSVGRVTNVNRKKLSLLKITKSLVGTYIDTLVILTSQCCIQWMLPHQDQDLER